MDSNFPILPLEVIQNIIDIVAENDSLDHPFKSPNVKACSRTCQTIRMYSRRHIFRAIKLRKPEPENWNPERKLRDSIESFATLLTDMPEIAEHVRELQYEIHAGFRDSQQAALRTLERLTKLESLAIHFYLRKEHWFPWGAIASPLYSIFPYFFRLPTLSTLKLKNITHFTLSSLLPCKNLKTLHLESVSEDFAEHPALASPLSICLQELAISGDTLWRLNDQSSLIDLSRLKTVILWVHRFDAEYLPEILESANNVERLHLHVDICSSARHVTPIVSVCSKTLRILCLDVFLRGLGKSRGLRKVLTAIAGTNSIESLTLNLNFPGGNIATSDPGEDWDLLEDTFFGPGWPSLENIVVNMNFQNVISPRNKARMWKQSRMLFPRLSNLPSDSTLKFNFRRSGVPHSLSQS